MAEPRFAVQSGVFSFDLAPNGLELKHSVLVADHVQIGETQWIYARIEREEHARSYGVVHFNLIPWSKTADPETRILCVKAEGAGFKKGESWPITETKELVSCQDCIELIHS